MDFHLAEGIEETTGTYDWENPYTTDSLDVVYYGDREERRRALDECVHCKMLPEEHAGKKCLFDTTTYEPVYNKPIRNQDLREQISRDIVRRKHREEWAASLRFLEV